MAGMGVSLSSIRITTRNGQFTFAPGGPRSLSRIVVSDQQGKRSWIDTPAQERPARSAQKFSSGERSSSDIIAAVPGAPAIQLAQGSSGPRMPRGGNRRAFDDPMTLEQVFPSLRSAPGGAIIAVADGFFDVGGPAREMTAELTQNWSDRLVEQIKAVDPAYRFDSLGAPRTLQGQTNQLNRLRLDRASALYHVKGELRPLQVETLRFMQARADRAYSDGLKMLRDGKLKVRLSEQEALGNFVDREVRRDLRALYRLSNIDAAGSGPVRVNRRENDSSPSEQVFRRPDARVGNVAYDVTLSPKKLEDAADSRLFQHGLQAKRRDHR